MVKMVKLLYLFAILVVIVLGICIFRRSRDGYHVAPWANKDAGCYYVDRGVPCQKGYIKDSVRPSILQDEKCCPKQKFSLDYVGVPQTDNDILNYYGWGLVPVRQPSYYPAF